MSDAFLTTVIGGIIVAVVGGVIAFYFGGIREKQRQRHERQLEEQRRLDERNRELDEREEEEQVRRRERQRELYERSIEALSEIRVRAHSVADGLRSLAERVAMLRGQIPEGTTSFKSWAEFFSKYEELAQQRDAISSDMASIRSFYQKHTPYLETTSRDAFESFYKEFEQRYTLLSRHLFTEKTRPHQQQTADWFYYGPAHPVRITRVIGEVVSLGLLNRSDSKKFRQDLEEEFSSMDEGIESIRNWNFEAHEAAFNEEIDRIQGIEDDLP